MTQKYHYCSAAVRTRYLTDLAVKDVNICLHGNGSTITHDYSCPVCCENHAHFDPATGIMQLCRECQACGWFVVQHTPLHHTTQFWFALIGAAAIGFGLFFLS